MHSAGCGVLIADLKLHRTATEWLQTLKDGPKVHFQPTDVSDWNQLEAAFTAFEKEFGGAPDIVVPGAGVYEPSFNSFWEDVDEASHYKLFDINLNHPIKMTRLAIRKMRGAGKPGVIIHLSSVSAQRPSITVPLYAVSKAGISQFVRGMVQLEELAGIRVVGVAPGSVLRFNPTISLTINSAINTPLFHDNPRSLALIDLEKDVALPPEEVASAMMALLTDSKYPPGTILEVGDVGKWREVHLFNDGGPQGRATVLREKAKAQIELVKDILAKDGGQK